MEEWQKAVGVFDSGVGGLTVVRAIRERLPYEKIVYFGDTARVPYGNKSKNTIIRYALEIGDFLARQDIKVLVIACNTSSTYSLDILKKRYSFPVIGVIGPGAQRAIRSTKNKRVGLIGTTATIQGGAYDREIMSMDSEVQLFKQACPLFVPIVEEGLCNDKIAKLAADMYLSHLKKEKVDTLILGCTHYPLLKDTIKKVMGKDVELIDSAESTAEALAEVLGQSNLFNKDKSQKNIDIFVSDIQDNFKKISSMFLGKNNITIRKVDLDELHKN